MKENGECFDIKEIGPIHRTGNEGSSSLLSKNAANLDFVLSMDGQTVTMKYCKAK